MVESDPATPLEGCVVTTSFSATSGVIEKLLEFASVKPELVARNVKVPVFVRAMPLKLATPLLAAALSDRFTPPELIERLTFAELPVMTLPY